MKLSCMTWNVARKKNLISEQTSFINSIDADIVALQEITKSTNTQFQDILSKSYPHIISSFDLATDKSILIKKRMFGQIVASKYKLDPIGPDKILVPWTERVLSVKVLSESKFIFHTTHIPPGSSNGWIKIEMISGLTDHLIKNKSQLQILCGDFNTPQFELPKYGVVTFAQKMNKNGIPTIRKSFRGGIGKDWDAAERALFEELAKNGMKDSFRSLYPSKEEFSYQFIGKNRIYRKRFDHFFASDSFKVKKAKYLKDQSHLSDHFPLLVHYDLTN